MALGPFREDVRGGGWWEAVGLHPSLNLFFFLCELKWVEMRGGIVFACIKLYVINAK